MSPFIHFLNSTVGNKSTEQIPHFLETIPTTNNSLRCWMSQTQICTFKNVVYQASTECDIHLKCKQKYPSFRLLCLYYNDYYLWGAKTSCYNSTTEHVNGLGKQYAADRWRFCLVCILVSCFFLFMYSW